jgi:hypothetical protein
MKSEIIKCDTCNKEQSTFVLPIEWMEVTHPNYEKNDGREKHFCSKECLIEWASEGKGETARSYGEHSRTKEGDKITLLIDGQKNIYSVMCEKAGFSDVVLSCDSCNEAISLFKALKTVAKAEIGGSW